MYSFAKLLTIPSSSFFLILRLALLGVSCIQRFSLSMATFYKTFITVYWLKCFWVSISYLFIIYSFSNSSSSSYSPSSTPPPPSTPSHPLTPTPPPFEGLLIWSSLTIEAFIALSFQILALMIIYIMIVMIVMIIIILSVSSFLLSSLILILSF